MLTAMLIGAGICGGIGLVSVCTVHDERGIDIGPAVGIIAGLVLVGVATGALFYTI